MRQGNNLQTEEETNTTSKETRKSRNGSTARGRTGKSENGDAQVSDPLSSQHRQLEVSARRLDDLRRLIPLDRDEVARCGQMIWESEGRLAGCQQSCVLRAENQLLIYYANAMGLLADNGSGDMEAFLQTSASQTSSPPTRMKGAPTRSGSDAEAGETPDRDSSPGKSRR